MRRLIPLLRIIHRNMSSRHNTSSKNHYDSLEINSEATHNEIKSAYFKLSKQYHPDMNSSENAKVKFNDISTAYEVLGNHKKRKEYDRGLHLRPMYYDEPNATTRKSDINDIIDEAKRAHAAMAYNRPHVDGAPIYDFDAWVNAHYGKVFRKRQKDLSNLKFHQSHRNEKQSDEDLKRYDSKLFMFVVMTIFILCSSRFHSLEDLDRPVNPSSELKIETIQDNIIDRQDEP